MFRSIGQAFRIGCFVFLWLNAVVICGVFAVVFFGIGVRAIPESIISGLLTSLCGLVPLAFAAYFILKPILSVWRAKPRNLEALHQATVHLSADLDREPLLPPLVTGQVELMPPMVWPSSPREHPSAEPPLFPLPENHVDSSARFPKMIPYAAIGSQPIATGFSSRTWAIAPEGQFALAIEECLPEARSSAMDRHIDFLSRLSAPFQQVLNVRRDERGLHVAFEAFYGVSFASALRQIVAERKALPLDVWLRLCECFASSAQAIMNARDEGWQRLNVEQLGFDIQGRLRCGFVRPNVALAERASTYELGGPLFFAPSSPQFSPPVDLVWLATNCVGALTGEWIWGANWQINPEDVRDERWSWSADRHPQTRSAIVEVLNRALRQKGEQAFVDIPSMMSALRAAAGVEPASLDRLRDVLLGAVPLKLEDVFTRLQANPEAMPQSWHEGGLDAMRDRLMQSLVSFDSLDDLR